MRTTLDLNDALLTRAKAEAVRQRTTLTRLIEEGLALRLEHEVTAPNVEPAFRWIPFHGGGGMMPGIDPSSNASIYAAVDEEYDLRQAGLLPFRDSDE